MWRSGFTRSKTVLFEQNIANSKTGLKVTWREFERWKFTVTPISTRYRQPLTQWTTRQLHGDINKRGLIFIRAEQYMQKHSDEHAIGQLPLIFISNKRKHINIRQYKVLQADKVWLADSRQLRKMATIIKYAHEAIIANSNSRVSVKIFWTTRSMEHMYEYTAPAIWVKRVPAAVYISSK